MSTSVAGNDAAAFGADESIDVTVFTTRWCPHCLRLKHALRRHDISWHEIDIETDCAGADFVAAADNGNRTVPTVLFHDGTVVTNPPIRTVLDTLVALAPPDTSAANIAVHHVSDDHPVPYNSGEAPRAPSES